MTTWSKAMRCSRQMLLLLCTWCLLGAATVSTAAAPSPPKLTDMQGKPLNLQEYRGRVVLLNFWATWCAPCRVEMPELIRLSRQFDAKRAVVLGIAPDDRADVQAYLRKSPVDYRVATGDPDAIFAWTESLGNATAELPFTVLIDARGVIRWRKSGGAIDPQETARLIQRLLTGQSI